MALPTQLGKYRVIASLGQGGMARVLLAVASGKAGFEKLLVVKELREELVHDPEFLTMFLDEARLAARMNHPNVVQTYEVAQDGDRHFIAMEYLEGQSLITILRKLGRQKVPLGAHVRVLIDALNGLDYAHTLTDFDGAPLSIVHRDVSPHNVFVTYTGQVKVVDFGIAKAAGAATQTKTGIFKGKPSYIAPEQAQSLPVDARADVFAVGVMLWEAVAKQRLSNADSEAVVLTQRIGGLERKLRDVVPDAPEGLVAICEKAMAIEAADRYESAAAMRDALEAWLDAQPHRAQSKELARLVAEAFEAERTALRGRIDAQLKKLRESSGDTPLAVVELVPSMPPRIDATPSQRDSAPRDSARRSREDDETINAANVATRHPPPPRSTLRFAWIGALVVVAGVAGVLLLRGRGGATSAATDAAPTTIAVSIAYGPANAVASLDGTTLEGKPFKGKLPRDGRAHTLEVRAPAYVTEKRMLSFDRDVDLTIELTPEAASLAPSPAIPPEGSAASSARPPGDKAVAALPPAPRPAAPKEPREPQTKPAQPPAPQHGIDEQNPYPK